jgi:phosphoribosylanthranilate isomerase
MAAEVGLAAVQLHGDESPETYMDRGDRDQGHCGS